MGEFELIKHYFKRPQSAARLGIGDDGAIFVPPPGHEICVSTDLLIEGQHFLSSVAPVALGHKALAVNLSDLAAMGAAPHSFTLSLGLPQVDENWVADFARGLFGLADQHGCSLIGGDTTAAPCIMLSLTVIGLLGSGGSVLRSGAKIGDDIWVSGSLGDGAVGLAIVQGKIALAPDHSRYCVDRLERPIPRLGLGVSLVGIATSMMDLSDGLAGDLPHILAASGVSARVEMTALPLSAALQSLPTAQARETGAGLWAMRRAEQVRVEHRG